MQENTRTLNSQYIYETIKKKIIYLELKPGEELSIVELSQNLKVSRSPIRDALIHLQDEGLVNMLPQRGSWVSLIDMDMVHEELLFRLSLELTCLDRLKQKEASPSYLKKMEYLVELQKEALDTGSGANYYEADDKMHETYFEAAGLKRFWNIILKETGNYRRIRILSFYADGVPKVNIDQHESLIECLRNRDFSHAKEILKSHLSKLDDEVSEIIGKYPTYFKEA